LGKVVAFSLDPLVRGISLPTPRLREVVTELEPLPKRRGGCAKAPNHHHRELLETSKSHLFVPSPGL
jgi:hypothetical protein